MFLTLTANASLDRVLFIDRFTPETTNRATKMVDCVGGKGFDVSVALRGLGQETLAVGFVAGDLGASLVKLLDRYGIQKDLIWVEGETRLAHVIVERSLGRHSHIMAPGYSVTTAQCEEILQRLRAHARMAHARMAHAKMANWIIASGSLPAGAPPDFYRQVSEIGAQAGVPVLIDSSGEPMRLSLAGGPAIVKMNEAEFYQTFSQELGDLHEHQRSNNLAYQSIEQAQRYRLAALVITRGRRGILAARPEGVYLAHSPELAVINAAGAGDAVSAALTWRLASGDDWPAALRWATAAGAAATLTEATGECQLSDVEAILPAVEVERL